MNGPEMPRRITTFEHIFEANRLEAQQHIRNVELVSESIGAPAIYAYKGFAVAGYIQAENLDSPVIVAQRFDCPLFTLKAIDYVSLDDSLRLPPGQSVRLPIVSNMAKGRQVQRSLVYAEQSGPNRAIAESSNFALIAIGQAGLDRLIEDAQTVDVNDLVMSNDQALRPILDLLEISDEWAVNL